MPNLHPRPLLGGHAMPPIAGPVSEQLNKVAGKLVDFMRGTLEELFKELSSQVFTLFLKTASFLLAFMTIFSQSGISGGYYQSIRN